MRRQEVLKANRPSVTDSPLGMAGRAAGWRVWLAGTVIVWSALVAYWNSFSSPFIFDGIDAIVDNSTIRGLWSAWSPPKAYGSTIGRPLVNFSFAVNYAFGGLSVWGYHAVNLALHVLAGLVLFGLLRRTFRLRSLSGKYGSASLPLALAGALLWVVHPLVTVAVTYVAQRSELLMTLLYLLTLYCFVRGTQSGTPAFWNVSAVLACLLGMASKEVMVSAPVMVLLYDRTFVAGSFREAWKQRGKLHLSLFATWVLLGYLVVAVGDRGGGVASNDQVSWGCYVLTQFWAVVRYLQLTVIPYPLVFDYGQGTLIRSIGAAVPYALVVVSAFAGMIVSLRRWPAVGFLGFWFFAVLAPSSSVISMPTEVIAEHRMYLPSAIAIILLVLMIYSRLGRRSYGVFAIVAAGFVLLTHSRNEDYRSKEAIWTDTVAKAPNSWRAHYNYGNLLLGQDRLDEAMVHYNRALELRPDLSPVWDNLGLVLERKGRGREAMACYQKSIKFDPTNLQAYQNYANALIQLGRVDEAIQVLRKAVRLRSKDPTMAISSGPHNLMVEALMKKGMWGEAVKFAHTAFQLWPDDAAVCNNLAWVLAVAPEAGLRNGTEAVRAGLQAEHLSQGTNSVIIGTLAAAYAEVGRFPEAIAAAERAMAMATNPGQIKILQTHIWLYESGRPFHESVPANSAPGF